MVRLLIKILALWATGTLLWACAEKQNQKAEKISANKLLLLHRPFSGTTNISSGVIDDLERIASKTIHDNFVTSKAAYKSALKRPDNLIIFTENYEAYRAPFAEKYISIPVDVINQKPVPLFLYTNINPLESHTTAGVIINNTVIDDLTAEDLVKIFEQKLRMNRTHKNIEWSFVKKVTPQHTAIISDTDLKDLGSKVNKAKSEIYRHSWLISKPFAKKLITSDKFKSLKKALLNYSFDYINSNKPKENETLRMSKYKKAAPE